MKQKIKNTPLGRPGKALILSDTTKIRRKLQQKCQQSRKSFEKAEQQLQDFKERDEPDFQRWFYRECGPLQAELRTVDLELQHHQLLINETHWRSRMQGKSLRQSYQELQDEIDERRRVQETLDEEFKKSHGEQDARTHGFEFRHKREIWEEDDDFMNEADDIPFADILKALLGRDPPQQYEDKHYNARLRSVYREVCRKLHPDTGATQSEHAQNLWHEAQQAYAEKDLAHLENLLALSEMDGKSFKSAVTCSQIQSIIRHYQDGMRSLRRLIADAKCNIAWGFHALSQDAKQARLKSIKAGMEYDLARAKQKLDELNQVLERLRAPPPPRSPKKKPRPNPANQARFEFE